jgi:hydroxymethylpyrimidine/phosphomethylpyrimidine kinase
LTSFFGSDSPPGQTGKVGSRQNVLCVSGLDPSGGAGIQADIETLAARGCHALPVVSALTVQTTANVQTSTPVDADLLDRQIEALRSDCPIHAVKIGLLGSSAQIAVLRRHLDELRVPVVCDPVLRAGGGTELADAALTAALRERLLPSVTMLTPNAAEARRLVPAADSLDACAAALLAAGCGNVLVTGGDEPGPAVVDFWYGAAGARVRYESTRLPETFHGAGCTLAAALAAGLARGEPLPDAIAGAQRYVRQALLRAYAAGRGRRIPGRLPRD